MSETPFQFRFEPSLISIVDKNKQYDVSDLFLTFPHATFIVLDFALQNQQQLPHDFLYDRLGRFIATHYQQGQRQAFNIDHHNSMTTTENFSATHQVISALQEGLFVPGQTDQLVIINHDDTDSFHSSLLATHPDVPDDIQNKLATAAAAADHTGEANELVNLVDTFYKSYQFSELIPLINSVLRGEKPIFKDEEKRQKFEHYQQQPHEIKQLLEDILAGKESHYGRGFYDPESKILNVEPNDASIDTIRIFPIIAELQIPVSIIMTSRLLDSATQWWKISLRSGVNFPTQITLDELAQELNLSIYGYGGRQHAGGIGRHRGERTIAPPELFQLLKQALSTRMSRD